MLTTSASQPAYGRTICPGKGLFVTVTTDPDTATVEDQPQNGSVTFDPETGGTLYRVSKSVTVIVSPTAMPWTPRSKPLMTCRGTAPTENDRGCHVSRHRKLKAFGYDALSFAMDARLVSNTSPSSANVPT